MPSRKPGSKSKCNDFVVTSVALSASSAGIPDVTVAWSTERVRRGASRRRYKNSAWRYHGSPAPLASAVMATSGAAVAAGAGGGGGGGGGAWVGCGGARARIRSQPTSARVASVIFQLFFIAILLDGRALPESRCPAAAWFFRRL